MNQVTRQWGIRGAICVLGAEFLLVVVQESLPSESLLRDWVHGVVYVSVAPVVWIWESLGLLREGWMLFTVVPVFGSIVIYLSGIGFIAGVMLSKLRRET